MALNSINTNIAAYYAQRNIGSASAAASSSIARLSSGERIVRAADDVAALSVGTSLRSQVSTLKQALANAAQGNSLLQVADSALGQVGDLLQRQKAISTQANSGTLSDTERSYLNQEFQALAKQIDQVASTTTFSSVKLLNGGLSGSTAVSTNNSSTTTATSVATAGAIVTFANAVPADGDKITINGVTVTFTTAAIGTAAAQGKVSVGTAVADTAANLVNFLNSNSDARLANLNFTSTGGAVSANNAAGKLTGAYVVDAASVSVGTPANVAIGSAANRTITATGTADGLTVDRTRALGAVTGSLLSNGGLATNDAGSAINLSAIKNNAAFVGKIGGDTIGKISGTFNATDNASFKIKVGDITYSTAQIDVTNAGPTALLFTGTDQYGVAAGGTFTVNLKGGAIAAVASQSDVDSITAQINDAFSGVTFAQNRDITTFQEGQVLTSGGIQVGNLDGFSANLRSSSFGSVNIESIKITAPTAGGTDARFEVVINGETFVSAPGTGNQIGTNSAIALQSTSNPANVLTLNTGSVALTSAANTALDLGTQAKADVVAKGLQDAFGLTGGGSKLNLQVGTSAQDVIGVKINDVSTGTLYNGASLDVSTISGAQAASAALDAAIGKVSSARADVGALQSRIDFTSANLESSIQNQDAARGILLDTDVASEATSYATAQVQLQAGIAVLAQANQLPQNLLKLIG